MSFTVKNLSCEIMQLCNYCPAMTRFQKSLLRKQHVTKEGDGDSKREIAALDRRPRLPLAALSLAG
jgi:hypothetical protein